MIHKTLLVLSMLVGPAAQASDAPSSPFADNPQLPPMFRQLHAPRPDGSEAVVFLGNFRDALAEPKPLLIYIEGSGAMSQFVVKGDMVGYTMYGLIADRFNDRYQVATIEKRGVPFGWSVEKPGGAVGASEEYQRYATLEDRVADVRLAISALIELPQVDGSRVVLVGHSEGADVAAAVAGEDDRVSHVACLSGGGAPQFFDFFIGERARMQAAGASGEEVDAALVELQAKIREILSKPDSIDEFWRGHAYRRWASFASQAAADALVESSARIFVAQGSEDSAVPIESFDYLVTRLLTSGHEDAVIKRYTGRDHGFGGGDLEPHSGLVEVIEEVLSWVGP